MNHIADRSLGGLLSLGLGLLALLGGLLLLLHKSLHLLHLFDQESTDDPKNIRDSLFLLVSNIRVSQFASVGSGDASLGSGKSAERGSLQSGDTCGSEGSPSLQVLDRELATY